MSESCLFCKIVEGSAPCVKILESGSFIVIKNKYPQAPIHVLVLDKKHREKTETMKGDFADEGYWDKIMGVTWKAIVKLGLNKTGYKIVNNGAGYNHFEHQHLHIMGGSKEEPGGVS